jgi:hypothetical protein
MGAVCWGADQAFFTDLAARAFWQKGILLGGTISAAALVYFLAAKLLRVGEAEEALGMLTRKLRR